MLHFSMSSFKFSNSPHKCEKESADCNVHVSVPDPDIDCVMHDLVIDKCILGELQWLWKQGIRTCCSCCGHGLAYNAFITVEKKYEEKMIELGYKSPPDKPGACENCDEGIMYVPKSVLTEDAKKPDFHNGNPT